MVTYQLQRQLAQGGFADVHLAIRSDNGREYAVKRPRELWDPNTGLRLREEAARQRRAAGEFVVPIVDENHNCERPFVVLEYMPNGSLYDRIVRDRSAGRFPWRGCCALEAAADIARAIAHVHAKGIVHHDVKPANVLYDAQDRLILSDFGCAATKFPTGFAGSAGECGTLAYGAPEQPYESTAKVDIYPIGVILYELLMGYPLQPHWWAAEAVPWPFPGLQGTHAEIVEWIRRLAGPHPEWRPAAPTAALELRALQARFLAEHHAR